MAQEKSKDDPAIHAPLAALHGAKPPAPAWFERALAQSPERGFVDVEGARIETLTWGDFGKPGLLLLHGSGAHAHWYSFLAPFLAHGRRVVAMSWSGMGGSDWRPTYARAQFVREALAVTAATGLFAGPSPPVVVGHSFGGRIAVDLAAAHGERFGATVVVDPPIFAPHRRREPSPRERPFKPHRVYGSFADAMARFRFSPPQRCEHLYVVDHIARLSLKPARSHDGASGWTWRFDSFLWRDIAPEDPAPHILAARCPLALVRGGASRLFHAEDAAYMRRLMAKGSPIVEIPEAEHHVMIDQPLAFVAAIEALLSAWPQPG